MRLKSLVLNGFKSFAQKTILEFGSPIVSIVGPNGSGKSNVVEAIRYVLGEQSMKSMRGKIGLDLIFKGSKNLPKAARATVSVHFDNSDKVFKLANDGGESINLNYDIVSITREVYPDGLNKYILNGSEVRLKDIHNLLTSVNVGSSGHHIISQGEADRILNANGKERRAMVEDALGLRIYQFKIKESERKLDRAEENMKEVIMLRRENAPHLSFLKKQVEKFEKAKEIEKALSALYREYLKKESVYLEAEKKNLSAEKNKISGELEDVAGKISGTENKSSAEGNKKIGELKVAEEKLNEIRRVKNEIERKLGRLEGMVEVEKRRKEKESEVIILSLAEIKSIIDEIHSHIEEALQKENLAEIKPILGQIKNTLNKFNKEPDSLANFSDLALLEKNQKEIFTEMGKIEREEGEMLKSAEVLKQEINQEIETLRNLEREKFAWRVKHQELSSALNLIEVKEENLSKEVEMFENEIKEGVALVGPDILSYKSFSTLGLPAADKTAREELRRKIERLKIKLEDAGLGEGVAIMKEYGEVSERDNFLAKEMEDLTKSVQSLVKLIADLKEKIDKEFAEGVKKINAEFQEFFSLMFGGGNASLSIVAPNKKPRRLLESGSRPEVSREKYEAMEEEMEERFEEENVPEPGIEINVSLPHKKVRELHALSGGERSLTSIALLFAMSQVNPPPFLVLDETDATLDEANSRKFGDILQKLSRRSGLIVVTHNRETMSRANALYGVTIGPNGASKLLSVKFDEATAIAQ